MDATDIERQATDVVAVAAGPPVAPADGTYVPLRVSATAVGESIEVRDGVPFVAGAPVPCDGQLLKVPLGRYDWVHALAIGGGSGEETELLLHYVDGVDPEWLRLTPAVDAPTAARVPVARRSPLRAVRLPAEPALHLHALTLERGA